MSFMFEVYYRPPADPRKEAELTARVERLGGHRSYREAPAADGGGGVCLTDELDDRDQAGLAAEALRKQGEHVEGPVDHGP
jgi:hypothetical protein